MSAFEDLVERQREATAAGRCGCLCGQPLAANRRRGVRYRDEHHKQRAYRARVDARAADRGVATKHGVMTLESLPPASDTGNRNGDAPTARQRTQRRRQPELRISFRKAVAILAHELEHHDVVDPPEKAPRVAELWLAGALSDRQRDALARMRAREGAGA